MAGTPALKIYRDGRYVAACKHPEDAAAIAGMSRGTEVRHGHKKVIFVEGSEVVSAAESWDAAAELMMQRIRDGNDNGYEYDPWH